MTKKKSEGTDRILNSVTKKKNKKNDRNKPKKNIEKKYENLIEVNEDADKLDLSKERKKPEKIQRTYYISSKEDKLLRDLAIENERDKSELVRIAIDFFDQNAKIKQRDKKTEENSTLNKVKRSFYIYPKESNLIDELSKKNNRSKSEIVSMAINILYKHSK